MVHNTAVNISPIILAKKGFIYSMNRKDLREWHYTFDKFSCFYVFFEDFVVQCNQMCG